MVAGIGEALTSLKIAFDIAKSIKDLDNRTALNNAVIELQQSILSAQEAALTARSEKDELVSRISQLEKEVTRLEQWDANSEEYQLTQIDAGAFAFMKKESARGSEPPCWFCVDCFQNNRLSTLQPNGGDKSSGHLREKYKCGSCGSVVSVHFRRRPDRPYVSGD